MSDDIAVLGLSIESTQAGTAATALDKLTAAGQSAADSADKLAASGAKSETVLRAIQAAADRSGVSFDEMNKKVDDAAAATTSSASASTKAASATTAHATALGKTETAAKGATTELTNIDKIAAILESRMLSLGNNAGLLGNILGVIGPEGLAAAAGFGAIVVAVDQLVTSANRMGDFALQLQTLASSTGLASTQIQALDKAAADFGLSATQTGAFLDRFTQQMDALRKGSGNLYTELLKIDPALLAQISVAKTTTDQLNLLANAYVKAGASKNALATAAGGGRGTAGATGLLLGNIAANGGVDAVTDGVNKLDLVTNKQTDDWAKLKVQIDESASTAKNNIASIFTGAVLEQEKSFFDGFLSFSESAKSFTLSSDFQKFMDIIKLTHSIGNALTVPSTKSGAIDLSTSDIAGGMTTGRMGSPVFEGPPAPVSATPAVQASMAAAQVSFLGSAATSSDKYDAAVKKLNADVAQNSTLSGLQGRALAGLGLDKAASDAGTYASALGPLATTQDKVNVASLNFQKAMLVNGNLTKDQLANVKLVTAANDEWSRASQSAQIGVFDMASAQKAVNDQLQVAIAEKLLDPNNATQFAAAVQAAATKLQNLSDAAKVAGSALPQLTQLGLDAGNVNKQFDTMATTSFNAVAPALEGILNGTTTLSAGFKNLGLSIITAMEDAIIKIAIVKPMIDALQSSLGSGGLLSFLGVGATGTSAAASGTAITDASGDSIVGGISFAAADGGTFGPGWGVVGERGPELIKVHNGGVTVIPNNISKPYLPGFADGGSLSSSGNVTRLPMGQDNSAVHAPVTVMIDARGADPAGLSRVQQQLAQLHADLPGRVVSAVKDARKRREL
jgi:hypothetical protein